LNPSWISSSAYRLVGTVTLDIVTVPTKGINKYNML
jgi:hypothetical protein